MNILLLNDTRIEDNFGCHATVGELLTFLRKCLPDANIVTCPLGTEYQNFVTPKLFGHSGLKALAGKIRRSFRRFAGAPRLNDWPQQKLDSRYWEQHFSTLLSQQFKQQVERANWVVVNVEGTMHHNTVGGIALLTMAHYAKTVGKTVIFMNGSIDAMSTWLIKKVLKEADLVSVREPASREALRRLGISAELVPDFAFLAAKNLAVDGPAHSAMSNDRVCLFNPGILGAISEDAGGVGSAYILDQVKAIRKAGLQPMYLKLEDRESPIEDLLKADGVNCAHISSHEFHKQLTRLFAQCELVITGRFHLAIFSLLNEIPTLLLQSNTHKNEGLLELLNAESQLVKGKLKSRDITRYLSRRLPLVVDWDEILSMYENLSFILEQKARSEALESAPSHGLD